MSKLTLQGVKGHRQVGHVVYDFAKDGGTHSVPIDLFTLAADTIVHDFWFEVETAVTSGGSATLEVGVTAVDTDGILTQAAKTVYAIDVVSGDKHKGVYLSELIDIGGGDEYYSKVRYKVTAATVLSLLIGTASLTAGKVHFYCEYSAGY